MNAIEKKVTAAKDVQGRKMVPLRLVLMPFAIIFVAIVLFMVFAAMAPKPEKQTVVVKAPIVDVMPLQAATVNFVIKSQGTVVPRTETTLISEVSGQVKKVSNKFVVGGYFKKGEFILEIDPISYEVGLLQAQARLDAANARFVEEKARSQQAEHEWRMTGKPLDDAPVLALRKPMLQQAQADINAAKADVKNAGIKLARTKITAPYDAMVKKKVADIGQYVSTGSELAVTFAVDYAEVRLPVKANELPYVSVPKQAGSEASKVALSNSSDNKAYIWHSSISRTEGVVDSKSRVNYLVVAINDPYNFKQQADKPELHIGAFVQAEITALSLDGVYAIPRAALRTDNSVYLLNDQQQLQVVPVDVFYSDHQYFYSRVGLKDGQQLVLTNLQTPVEGMALRLADTANAVSDAAPDEAE